MNQVTARECYIVMLEMDDHQQTMCIGEQRAVAEPVEELEEVILDDSRPERTTRVGTLASWPVRQELTTFPKRQSRRVRLESRGHARSRLMLNSAASRSDLFKS